jgi:hypothetical protein
MLARAAVALEGGLVGGADDGVGGTGPPPGEPGPDRLRSGGASDRVPVVPAATSGRELELCPETVAVLDSDGGVTGGGPAASPGEASTGRLRPPG